MIILKNTINTQTVFINKRKDVGLKAAVQYYTKAEADEKFQPKGDYVTPEDVDSIVGSVVDEKIAPIQNEIDELEASKQEVFQVNQPLYFERDDEDLTLNVNLENYATKEDLENIDVSGKQDLLVSGVNIKTINDESILGSGNINTKYTAGDNISILDSEISWEAPKVQFVNTIFTNGASLKYALADFDGEYTEKEFPLATTEVAGLMSPEDKVKLDSAGDSVPYVKLSRLGVVEEGDLTDVFNALQEYKPAVIYLQDSVDLLHYVLMESFVVNSANSITIVGHNELGEDEYGHNTFRITFTKSDTGVTSSAISRYKHNYVSKTTYDTKMTEIDTAISDLQAQVGDIATVLDNINGETI